MNSLNNYNINTIELINNIKFELKFRDRDDIIADKLNSALDSIINIFVLDQDPHAFASVPEYLPSKLIRPITFLGKDYTNFANAVLQWIPDSRIHLNDFISRCENNTITPERCVRTLRHDIVSVVLYLKENGYINVDNDGYITK